MPAGVLSIAACSNFFTSLQLLPDDIRLKLEFSSYMKMIVTMLNKRAGTLANNTPRHPVFHPS